jgi:hypothetical protein
MFASQTQKNICEQNTMFFYTCKSSDAARFDATSFVGSDLPSNIASNDLDLTRQDNVYIEADLDGRDFFCRVSDDEDNMSLDESCSEVATNPDWMELDGNIDGMEVDEDSFMAGLCNMMSSLLLKDDIYGDENDESNSNFDTDAMEVDEDSSMTSLCGAMSVLSVTDDDRNNENFDRNNDGNMDSPKVNLVFCQDDHSIHTSPRLPGLSSKDVRNFLTVSAFHCVFRYMSFEVCGKTLLSPNRTEVMMR